MRLLPTVPRALNLLRGAGFGIVVATNQSGVGRGYFTALRVGEMHAYLQGLLQRAGAYVDKFYLCPHTPDISCECRKPGAGMMFRAAQEYNLDLARCFVVGDRVTDMQMGYSVGATTVLVRTGYGGDHEGIVGDAACYVVDDLLQATTAIFQHRAP